VPNEKVLPGFVARPHHHWNRWFWTSNVAEVVTLRTRLAHPWLGAHAGRAVGGLVG